jgi:hypothetical protein
MLHGMSWDVSIQVLFMQTWIATRISQTLTLQISYKSILIRQNMTEKSTTGISTGPCQGWCVTGWTLMVPLFLIEEWSLLQSKAYLHISNMWITAKRPTDSMMLACVPIIWPFSSLSQPLTHLRPVLLLLLRHKYTWITQVRPLLFLEFSCSSSRRLFCTSDC